MSVPESRDHGNTGSAAISPDRTAMDEWVLLFANRNEMADEYARILRQEGPSWKTWPTLNLAILDRWSPAGLKYIKERAWKIATQNL